MTEALSHMTKLLTLIGLTILVFGYSYSPLLLHIYGGQLLSTGIGNLDVFILSLVRSFLPTILAIT